MKLRKADYCLMKGTYLRIKSASLDDIIRVTSTKSRTIRGRVLKSLVSEDVGKLYRYIVEELDINVIKKKDLMLELL